MITFSISPYYTCHVSSFFLYSNDNVSIISFLNKMFQSVFTSSFTEDLRLQQFKVFFVLRYSLITVQYTNLYVTVMHTSNYICSLKSLIFGCFSEVMFVVTATQICLSSILFCKKLITGCMTFSFRFIF